MVLGLREFRLPVMAVEVRIQSVVALFYNGPKRKYNELRACIAVNRPTDSLFFFDVAWAVVGILPGELIWMSLNGMGIKYLQHFAEVDALHQLVDLLIKEVVREHQQHLGYVSDLCQADNQVSQVDDACVHLHDNDDRVVLYRPVDVLVVNLLQFVYLCYLTTDFTYV